MTIIQNSRNVVSSFANECVVEFFNNLMSEIEIFIYFLLLD